ncbi:MAG: glycosyltransferase [Candidatus Altiarchaeales archaeon]|nr:glycosyltransferase [Candidatus Altiarchaeales archaeon]MBD3416727.1 glycosyltransferase [Candidatus Altiarchaeales archaeon]
MDLMYSILTLTVWFLSTYFIALVLLIMLEKREDLKSYGEPDDSLPFVSVVVPALNEEKGVLPALQSLYDMDYPWGRYEVIVVNDGSTDRTSDFIRDFISSHKEMRAVFIDRSENHGKAFSLNEGIEAAKGDYVATMDSDSVVKSDILKKTVGMFRDEGVGAVTVRVHVSEPRNLLERIVDIEYVVGLSLSLKILSYLNAMHVTPGPFSIYRKSMLLEIGGFDEHNIVEDMEIAFRIHKAGYRIENTLHTGVYTIVPSTLNGLYRQRKRWYSGSLITLLQHKDTMFNRALGCFGVFFLPLNYLTITLGLLMGVYSAGLLANNIFQHVKHLILTNFELLPFDILDFDLLTVSIFHFLMLSSMLSIALMTKASMSVMHRRLRENISGFIGFIFFFLLYQFFWLSSFYSVLAGRKVKWR